jgi:hypothetical protein
MGGFESILSKMSGGNFNWFLHTMLFMHTISIIQKQEGKKESGRKGDNSEDSSEDENI